MSPCPTCGSNCMGRAGARCERCIGLSDEDVLDLIAGEGQWAPFIRLDGKDDLLIDGNVNLKQLKLLVNFMEQHQ